MTDSQINVDPERIKNLSLELRLLSNSLQTDLALVQQAVDKLGNTWKDKEYEKFRNSVRTLLTRLKLISAQIKMHESDLQTDADALADYLRTQLHYVYVTHYC